MSEPLIWEVTLLLEKEVSDDEFNALYEAEIEGGVHHHTDGTGSISLGLTGPTLLGAIAEMVARIRAVGPNVVGIETELEDYASLADCATRLNGARTAESLRLLSLGKRGPGGFPKPTRTMGRNKYYSWAEVATWLHEVMGDDIPPVWPDLALADQALKLAAWARRTDHIAEVQRLVA